MDRKGEPDHVIHYLFDSVLESHLAKYGQKEGDENAHQLVEQCEKTIFKSSGGWVVELDKGVFCSDELGEAEMKVVDKG